MYSKKIELDEICARFKVLYSGAIADILDNLGFRNQVLPNEIRPLKENWKLAGPAYTAVGESVDDIDSMEIVTLIKSLAPVKRNQVCVLDAQNHNACAHWGEIMSLAVRNNGGQGVVINGGCRDIDQIYDLNFPVFCTFLNPRAVHGRWVMKEWLVPVKIGAVTVSPDDFIFGDINGVVAIPEEVVEEVLLKAENIYYRERKMLAELRMGRSPMEVYNEYGVF